MLPADDVPVIGNVVIPEFLHREVVEWSLSCQVRKITWANQTHPPLGPHEGCVRGVGLRHKGVSTLQGGGYEARGLVSHTHKSTWHTHTHTLHIQHYHSAALTVPHSYTVKHKNTICFFIYIYTYTYSITYSLCLWEVECTVVCLMLRPGCVCRRGALLSGRLWVAPLPCCCLWRGADRRRLGSRP